MECRDGDDYSAANCLLCSVELLFLLLSGQIRLTGMFKGFVICNIFHLNVVW